ncbi:MAG: hypothetical protein GF368_01255 [Candidatus Aenigmarchaeota archaeon]|nr:hypothetical protein [Candidatus Aenigmarchaeota archaeon]
MKAQVGVEYLIVTGIGLTLMLISVGYLYSTYQDYSDENKISLAKNSVNKIGETADLVFSQGPPAKMKIEIRIPKGIQEISFSNKTVLFKVDTGPGVNDISYNTVPQIVGHLPTNRGNYYVSLSAEEDYVNISVV